MRKVFLILGFALLTQYSDAQNYFSRQQLNADLDSMYVFIHELHPDMFAYTSQQEFENKLEYARQQLSDSMNIFEFYNVIAPVVALLGDGHTSVYFPHNQLREPGIRIFPFSVMVNYRDSSVVTTRDFSQPLSGLPDGAELLSINNRDIKDLVGKMMARISGEKDFFKAAMLNRIFQGLLFAMFAEEDFIVDYYYDGKHAQISIDGLSVSDINASRGTQTATVRPDYSISFDEENNIAIIDFLSFRDEERMRAFLDSAFTLIHERGIGDLIIDIRQNSGGSSMVGDEFFQYISPVPFQQFGGVIVKVSERMKNYFLEHRNFNYPDSVGIRTYFEENLKELRENPLRFNGNIVLLTSNFSFSSAAGFSWAFKHFEMGTVVGEETGGLAVCFGDVIPQLLPNSGLQMGVSHKKFYQFGATDENVHGTIPDYEVPAKEAMDFAIDLIIESRL
ncbi:MAG: hypothetical protein EA393_10665 [Bacteroidetes bacterium]|nr:MAG: hypothetical protein EA393_10665 [Bacteroidota bacterium]